MIELIRKCFRKSFVKRGLTLLYILRELRQITIVLNQINNKTNQMATKEEIIAKAEDLKQSVADAVKKLTDIINNNKLPDGSVVFAPGEAEALLGTLNSADETADNAGA